MTPKQFYIFDMSVLELFAGFHFRESFEIFP